MNQIGHVYTRPWGTYRTIEQTSKDTNNYQIKHIVVFPKKRLSLQYHEHRHEHWTVIQGSGVATIDGTEIPMEVHSSVYIPVRSSHRMTNPTDKPMEFIEIQLGSYLGEDDIVRLEDDFGRIL